MTEAEWLKSTDPDDMSYFLLEKVSDRKLRLFSVACCRRIWHLLTDERSRRAVEVAEQYAEGKANQCDLSEARIAASNAYQDGSDAFYGLRHDMARPHSVAPHGATIHVVDPPGFLPSEAIRSARYSVFHNVQPFSQEEVEAAVAPEAGAQVQLLRCVVGNPFRPATVEPSWLTETVVALAAGIHADQAFDRLPILADALEDAGCDNEDLLNHCRGEGPHVRGCWVVDLLLANG